MKVKETRAMKLADTDPRFPVVTDSSRHVWYYRCIRVGGVRANSRKSCVPILPALIPNDILSSESKG